MKVTHKSSGKSDDCNVCILGKLSQNRNTKPDAHATAPLELVHTDLTGPADLRKALNIVCPLHKIFQVQFLSTL